MAFTNAAEQILSRFGDREPMHYRTLTERALEFKLISTSGQTPAATMYAQILTEIRRHQESGKSPRFVKHGRGMVGLTAWLPVGVARRIEEQNREVRRALLERVSQSSPAAFENLVGELLVAIGFEGVQVTRQSHDGGIDVRGTLVVGDAVRIRMAVQAKRWENNVQKPVVQQVRGSLGAHEQALIITTSGFSDGAKKEAQRADATPVALVGGEQLATLLSEHGIGVRRTSHDLLTLDDDPDGSA